MLDDYGRETFAPLEEEIDAAIIGMLEPEGSLGDAGRFYEAFTDAMRAHGLLWLLVDADPQTAFRDLVLCGHARRHFLRRCQRAKHVDQHCAASRFEPFLCAVVAESWAVTRDIATLSPADWLENREYEDDFCYARFLHLWVTSLDKEPPRDELGGLLDRFEGALRGVDASRLDVCRALLAGDGRAFTEAFESLVQQRQEEVQARLPLTTHNPVARIDCEVFVEGLALLRLADRQGFQTETEYPGCPRVARVRSKVGDLPDTLPPP